MSASRKLRIGAAVEVCGTRFHGWHGKVTKEAYGFYHLDMSHDAQGARLACKYRAGPFARKELKRLPHGPNRAQPAMGATDGAVFSEDAG